MTMQLTIPRKLERIIWSCYDLFGVRRKKKKDLLGGGVKDK